MAWYCKVWCCIHAGCRVISLGVGRLDIGVGSQDDDDDEEEEHQDDHNAPSIEFDHLW